MPSNCIAKSIFGSLRRPKQQPGQVCFVAVLGVLRKLHHSNEEAVAARSSYNNKLLHNYCHMTCFTNYHPQNYLFM